MLQASVVDIQGKGVQGLSVRFGVSGASGKKSTASATPCGLGCYRAAVGIGRPLGVDVQLGRAKPVSFAMPATWPAPSGARIVELAEAAWRKLHTLAYHDSLGDGKVVLETDWKIVGPDRIEFHETGLRRMSAPGRLIEKDYGAGIIIGDRRWDRLAGSSKWLPSPQTPVRQPIPFWQSSTDARLLGTVMWHGAPAWKVSFFDLTGGPGWFTIIVDKATLHTRELWMTAADHFMHETYTAFDTPIEITPPKPSVGAALLGLRQVRDQVVDLLLLQRRAEVRRHDPCRESARDIGPGVDDRFSREIGERLARSRRTRRELVQVRADRARRLGGGEGVAGPAAGVREDDGAGGSVAGRRGRGCIRSRRLGGCLGLLLLHVEHQHRRDHRHEEGDADHEVQAQGLAGEVRVHPGHDHRRDEREQDERSSCTRQADLVGRRKREQHRGAQHIVPGAPL